MSMNENILGEINEDKEAEYYLTISSGGSASVLGGLGALLGCRAAGLSRFRMIGGVSGGSIVTSLAASGLDTKQLLRLGMALTFGNMVSFWSDVCKFINPFAAPKPKTEEGEPQNWRCTGLYGTEPLAQTLRRHFTSDGSKACTWPAQFWTMATTKEGAPVIIKADGVYLVWLDGRIEKLAAKPPSLETAVQMSCAIPGVISAFRYKGIFLFDGALSRYGICPVGMQIRHFGTDPRKIIACHIGDDSKDPLLGRMHSLCRLSWGVDPRRNWGEETAGVVEFRPKIEHVHTMKFRLSRDEKWLAILIGFEACVARLALEGILHGECLQMVQDLLRDLGYWQHANPAKPSAPQPVADRTEACLREYGFF